MLAATALSRPTHLRAIAAPVPAPSRAARPLHGEFYPDTLWRVLSANEWFASLDGAAQEALVTNASLSNVPKGTVIDRSAARGMLVTAVRGVMQISRGTGTETTVADVVEPGHWFGYLQSGDAGAESFELKALRACTLLKLDSDALAGLMHAHPQFAQALAQLNWGITRRLLSRLEHVSLPSYRERVRHTLLLLAQRFGAPSHGEWGCVGVKFSQGEIAALARVSRARTNEVMNEFARSGLLRDREGCLEVRRYAV